MFQAPTLVSLIRFGEDEVPALDFNTLSENPAFKEYVGSLIAKETEGLRSKADQVLGEKKKAQEALRKFESGLQEEEDRKAFKEGRLDLDSILDRRQQALSKTHQEALAARDSELENAAKAIADREARLQAYQIRTEIGQVAIQNEFFQPSAIDDLNYLAQQTWKPSDNGLVARDAAGNIILGRNGAPITPAEWLEGLKTSKPHYFKNLPGSGSRGGQGSGVAVSLGDWQKKLAVATGEEKATLLAKYKSGEISIQR